MPKIGQYFQTSWGYDQTNYDFLVVVAVSPSGKTATCRMVRPINMGNAGIYEMLTPGAAYGEPFTMRVQGDILRGSYPYCQGDRRLDTFSPCKLGDVHYQTMPQFGH